jgi:hypothetical protein
MNENEYRPLGTISGGAVGVQPTPDGQDVLIQQCAV